MIKQKPSPWGWHIYRSLLLGKQKVVNSREEFAKPCDLHENSIPHSTLNISLLPNSIWTDFISQMEMGRKQIFSKWSHEEWACLIGFFWAGINIMSWGALWCAFAVGFVTPPASRGGGRDKCHHLKAVLLPPQPSHLQPAWIEHPGLVWITCDVGEIFPSSRSSLGHALDIFFHL